MFTYPYITLIASYLLVGVVIIFLLELAIRKHKDLEVDNGDRFRIIAIWPFLAFFYIYFLLIKFINK